MAILANCKHAKTKKFCCSYDELSELIYTSSLCLKSIAALLWIVLRGRTRTSASQFLLLISWRWSENYLTNCFIIGQKLCLLHKSTKNTGTMANDRRQWYPGFNNERFPADREKWRKVTLRKCQISRPILEVGGGGFNWLKVIPLK